jgi:imidazolonepropionase-like amidohydrolase
VLAATCSILATLLSGGGASGADLQIENARIVDCAGGARSNQSVLIRNGRIVAVGEDISAPTDVEALDATGLTILPGLVDSHVHLASVPGALLRNDSPKQTRRLVEHHLRAYLASGVTTILDPAIPLELAEHIRALSTESAPEIHFLAPALTSPDGYATDESLGISFSPVSRPSDIEDSFHKTQHLAPSGVKVFIESGRVPGPTWPVHTPEMRDEIAAAASRHGRPIYVHANTPEDQAAAVELGAHALVHAGFLDTPPGQAFLDRLFKQGTFVMTTLSVQDALLTAWNPSRLELPTVRRVVPLVQLRTARDPASAARVLRGLIAQGLPKWIPSWLHGPIAHLAITEDELRERVGRSQLSVSRMHHAGIPLVLASDSGNWPLIPYMFHGPTTLREAELMQEAGVPPLDIVCASTETPAKMLGLEDEIGAVRAGLRADLVAIADDPLVNISALRTLEWVARNGVVKSPSAWLGNGPEPEPD